MEKLGQYFLTSKTNLQKIVMALDLKADDSVIEIGPGHGELTNELRIMNYELRITAIEKDEEFVRYLQEKFAQDKNIEIVEGDVLKILPELAKSRKIVGNIPYYITGHLLRIIGELENKPSLVVLTVQKEVAERICAPSQTNTGKKGRMNLLAASVQFWAEPEIIDYIPKTEFRPQPKVDSAIIRLVISSQPLINSKDYYELIKILFKQPRKTILNNLRATNKTKEEIIKILGELKINPADRPQNLSVEQIKELSTQIKY
ncbi:ribosomal RNA small subunit methyltransferase A [Candidatus Azambacteria bacterium RIFCSPHIGHO2_01_FULL_40_24]|uniref:Ribosomal RNA small subunit methyltransferase A n=2 Tax=Parcubacteria group TaxID=1794811 RepID=A0A1F5B367_9BACT|nr:MAG: ribosomal RNA small subunit methyltransferase A [Candidatus Azambacteria bacterium RIFCSPHIGHO2_01_FULL_40_24]